MNSPSLGQRGEIAVPWTRPVSASNDVGVGRLRCRHVAKAFWARGQLDVWVHFLI